VVTTEKLPAVQRIIDLALEEDVAHGDITSRVTVPETRYAEGTFLAKAKGVIAGLPVVEVVLHKVDSTVGFRALVDDGALVEPGTVLAEVAGRARSILTAERTALNFLQQLSGTATATRKLVDLIEGTRAKLVDTRKTCPGMRALQRYAVRMGGGANHRFHLADAVLIKDNHIAAAGGVTKAVRSAKESVPHTMKVEVECASIPMVIEALDSEVDIIMLDNFTLDDMRDAVTLIDGRALVEASGNITEKTIAAVARTGVDLISCGSITHSAPALDISLEFAG